MLMIDKLLAECSWSKAGRKSDWKSCCEKGLLSVVGGTNWRLNAGFSPSLHPSLSSYTYTFPLVSSFKLLSRFVQMPQQIAIVLLILSKRFSLSTLLHLVSIRHLESYSRGFSLLIGPHRNDPISASLIWSLSKVCVGETSKVTRGCDQYVFGFKLTLGMSRQVKQVFKFNRCLVVGSQGFYKKERSK
jgi:hypothetical protein